MTAETGALETKVWMDGEIVDAGRARVSVLDHGLLYGDGIFEGIRARARKVFRLDDHLARLVASAKAIALELPLPVSSIRDVVLDTIRSLGSDEAYVRLVVTRGEGPLGVDPLTCVEPRVICIGTRRSFLPDDRAAAGIALVTVSSRRPAPDALDPKVKSLNYLQSCMAKLEARRRGADDALILNGRGFVAESSVANVFIVTGSDLSTPPSADGCLEGITRRTVLELAPSLDLRAGERTLSRADLLRADEVFITGTGVGIVPVRSLDGQPIGEGGPGPAASRLRAAYTDLARSSGAPF